MALPAILETDFEPTEHPHIVRTPGICGGRPRVKNSRVSVRAIAELYRAGESAEEIAATFPHLESAAVYDAVSYFLDHRSEIRTEIEANRLEQALERHGATLGEDGVIRFEAS